MVPPFVLPRGAGEKRRLALGALMGVLAVVLGFIAVPVATAENLIKAGGYYYMAGIFSLFAVFAWRVAMARRATWRAWLHRPGWTGVALGAATAFVLCSDPFRHKVLFDEYVLQATAWHMHATKEIGTVIRAYDLFGTWQPIDTFLDKRPYFFAFLLSLVHDLTGYRVINVFFLNGALAAALLGLVYWLARQLTSRTGGLLAVALLATTPLLGQNATSAGMEIHNLTMLAFTMCAALLYLRAPDENRMALLCLSTVLLAQSRYESAAFVLSSAAVMLAGWRRAGRTILPWPALITPLLLVPYAWQNRVLSATPQLWQLQAGQKARFAASYLPGNLEGAWNFFFSFGPKLANSWWLSALGVGALLWLGAGLLRRRRPESSRLWHTAPAIVGIAYGVVVLGNLTMLMFYYWSRLDDTVASRFALPSCLMMALVAVVALDQLDRHGPAMRLAFAGTGVFLFVSVFPAMAHRFYTDENLVMQEVQWEHDVIESTGANRVFVISNKSTIPWVLWKIPALVTAVARDRGEQIRWHMQNQTFDEVIVAQALRPTTAEGSFGVDPDDRLPNSFHLETIAVKRFGGRMERLCRVVAIDPVERKTAAGAAPTS